MLETRPPSNVLSIHQIPENSEIQRSWTASASALSRTFVVDESDVVIAVMGATGSGKTTFINLASGSNLRVGRGLQSCTSIVQVAQPFELDGRAVTLIDTPGFDDTTRSDTDVLRMIATFLATAYEGGKQLAGVIYLHRISDFRMGGISTRNFKMFRQLCVSREVGEAREDELASKDMFFKPVLDKGGQLFRHDNTQKAAHTVLRQIMENHPIALQIQRELVDQKKQISETAAGEELNRELMTQIRKHRDEMRSLQEEMREAIRTKDVESRRELEIETRKLQTEMNRVQNDAHKLASEYSEEKRRMDERVQQLTEAAHQEHERANAESNRQMQALRRQLEQSASTSFAERQELNRQIEELRRSRRAAGGGFFAMIGRALDSVFGI